MKTKTSNLLCIGILTLGSTAMLGHFFNNDSLKNIGLATGAAPYTKVFCQAKCRETQRNYETFAADFTLTYKTPDSEGRGENLKITPELYQKIKGPYNRRNVYGAVIAYGPALPEAMRLATFKYALIDPGTVAKELGIPSDATDFQIIISSNTKHSNSQWKLNGK